MKMQAGPIVREAVLNGLVQGWSADICKLVDNDRRNGECDRCEMCEHCPYDEIMRDLIRITAKAFLLAELRERSEHDAEAETS